MEVLCPFVICELQSRVSRFSALPGKTVKNQLMIALIGAFPDSSRYCLFSW